MQNKRTKTHFAPFCLQHLEFVQVIVLVDRVRAGYFKSQIPYLVKNSKVQTHCTWRHTGHLKDKCIIAWLNFWNKVNFDLIKKFFFNCCFKAIKRPLINVRISNVAVTIWRASLGIMTSVEWVWVYKVPMP